MSLGSNTDTKYVNIKDGKVVYKEKDKELLYDFIEGELIDITTPVRTFNGKQIRSWYIKLKGDDNKDYVLSIGYNSGVAKTILNALASAEDFKNIRIYPYFKGGYTKASTYSNGKKLDWKYSSLPAIEETKVGDKVIKDDSKRMDLFANIQKDILAKIKK